MGLIPTMLAAGLILLSAAGGRAEIYIWTDARGIKHYSNTPPPAEAEVLERRDELGHDAESHRQRLSQEQASFQAYQEAEAQRVREARQLELIRQQQAAQGEAVEAARRAEAAAKEAAAAAEKARSRASGYVILPPRHRFPHPDPFPPDYAPPEPRRPRAPDRDRASRREEGDEGYPKEAHERYPANESRRFPGPRSR